MTRRGNRKRAGTTMVPRTPTNTHKRKWLGSRTLGLGAYDRWPLAVALRRSSVGWLRGRFRLVPAVGFDAPPAPGVHPRCRRAPGSSAVFPAGPRSLGSRRTPLWLRRPPHLACPAPLGLQEEDLGISLTARPGQLPGVAFVERRGNVQIGVPLRPTSAGRPRSGRGGSVRRAADASFPDPPGREQPSRPRAGPRSSRPVPAPGHDYGRE